MINDKCPKCEADMDYSFVYGRSCSKCPYKMPLNKVNKKKMQELNKILTEASG